MPSVRNACRQGQYGIVSVSGQRPHATANPRSRAVTANAAAVVDFPDPRVTEDERALSTSALDLVQQTR